MRPLQRFVNPLFICAALATLAALLACYLTRHAPRVVEGLIYLDALASLWNLALWGALALFGALNPAQGRNWRFVAGGAAFSVGLVTATPLLTAVFFAVGALLVAPFSGASPRRMLRPGPALPAVLALALAFGVLALRNVADIGAATAGAALDSFVFLFALLSAASLLIPDPAQRQVVAPPLRFVWLFPLLRLYLLGPWNDGWSLATALLGASGAVWAALAALTQPEASARSGAARRMFLALALAVAGLGTSAGTTAACFLTLTFVVLGSMPIPADSPSNHATPLALWALSGALPFTAPFVAIWMSTSAAAAAGVTILAAVCWVVALLHALYAILDAPYYADTAELRCVAIAGAALGIGAPVVSLFLIQPVVEQLQGGLTGYGVMQIWPWVGVAAADSGNRVVSSFPTIAVAGLMLVLSALVFLLARWRNLSQPTEAGDAPALDHAGMINQIRRDVPWLGGGRRRAPGRTDDNR